MTEYYVPVFRPASDDGQESRLHLFNLGENDAEVRISGLDDKGRPPLGGDVSLTLEAGETRVLTAEQLESGADRLDGHFGDGSGRWRLFVTADTPLQVMSLGYSPDGFLANLSRGRPAVPRPVVVHPDLVVGRPSVNNSQPQGGEAFTLSATVTNQGDGDAHATTLRYYLSANTTISRSDTGVGIDAVGALATSDSSSESITLNRPVGSRHLLLRSVRGRGVQRVRHDQQLFVLVGGCRTGNSCPIRSRRVLR